MYSITCVKSLVTARTVLSSAGYKHKEYNGFSPKHKKPLFFVRKSAKYCPYIRFGRQGAPHFFKEFSLIAHFYCLQQFYS